MNTILVVFFIVLVIWLLFRLLNFDGNNVDVEKKENGSVLKAKKQSFLARIFSKPLPYDDEAITWCANFLIIDKNTLISILRNTSAYYSHFKLAKRSGGYRTISAPNEALLNIQRIIYKRTLLTVNIHPASMGFRKNFSVTHNAKAHLGNNHILKVDLFDFFGSIKKDRVIKTFEKIGYPVNISQVLAELCTLGGKLPQGAPTSPTLSNIIAFNMDIELASIAQKNSLRYTRYADDLTFSGTDIAFEPLLTDIDVIIRKENFIIQRKKTRFLTEKKRKIVTGISISSGEKMTIPRAKRREIRKNMHYILTKGLVEHQRFRGSTDPVYLQRLMGYLNFWLMVEPENEYVKRSIAALKKLKIT
ncbi:RNA-directed DNA polymerase [Apibacter muscae]|uniref:RNA-directed DNA polymerase n=1 Tax=Apibacter muscae TaxID=2509004 RepID=A0A563DCQ2_9FLAO|nr:retron St85 family RNA-directed DNA polymerase [Apibacter muscae]TWP27711.1 RNA-directed DNA polymerase [Apibacter muscae]TWP29531.1 RNA-directed DNA polymerase [Apibacter muscae]